MYLLAIEAENFMSYEKLERNFKGANGLTLIEGVNHDEGDSNGSGKSVPWDLISWVLFGETVRGLKSDEVIRRKIKKDCLGRVTFMHGSDSFVVTRYRGHTDKDDAGVKYGNRLIVKYYPNAQKLDEVIIEKGSIDATQKWLLDEIGIDFDLMRCTMLFAQGETFNFINETDKKQKEILSKIKRLDVQRGLDSARQELRQVESKRDEIRRKIEVLRSHMLEDPSTAFAAEIAEFEEDRKRDLADADICISRCEGMIDSESAPGVDLEKLAKAKVSIKEKINERENKIKDLRKRFLVSRQEALVIARSRIKKIAQLTSPTCPTCDGAIDKSALDREHKTLRANISVLEEAIARVEAGIGKVEIEILAQEASLAEVEDKVLEVKLANDRIKSFKEQLVRLASERKKIAERVNTWEARRADAVEKQKMIKVKMRDLAKDLAPLVDREPYLKFWEVGYSDKGIKSFLFDTVCSTLTTKTNHYLGILSGGSVSVAFDTQTRLKTGELREKFECMVVSDGESVPYRAYSGGEKTKISLAVDMALSDLMVDSYGTSFNVVVFDEQDLYLDRQGRQFYLQLLKERAKTQQVFVVAHDAEFKGLFDQSWITEKRDGVSRFVS